MTELIIPNDVTPEELALLDVIKRNMLRRLDDRGRFLFVYVIELGHKQYEAAEVLGIDESNIVKYMKRIREVLAPFK